MGYSITDGEPLYETPPRRIGKHEWKGVVYRHSIYGACIDWQWRALPTPGIRWVNSDGSPASPPEDPWQSMEKWPSYNDNDGCHAGCPRTVAKIYQEHKAEIKAALAAARGEPAPDTRQQALTII